MNIIPLMLRENSNNVFNSTQTECFETIGIQSVEKPVLEDLFYNILESIYSESYAKKLAIKLERYIHEKMAFPENGFYCFSTSGYLYRVINKSLVNTNTTKETFIIKHNSSLWENLQEDLLIYFDKSCLEKLTKITENITASMFSVSQIVVDSVPKTIQEVLSPFFCKTKCDELWKSITNECGISCKHCLVDMKNEGILIINQNGIIDNPSIDKIKETLKCIESSIQDILSYQVYNTILLGLPIPTKEYKLDYGNSPTINNECILGVDFILRSIPFYYRCSDSMYRVKVNLPKERPLAGCFYDVYGHQITIFEDRQGYLSFFMNLSDGISVKSPEFLYHTWQKNDVTFLLSLSEFARFITI